MDRIGSARGRTRVGIEPTGDDRPWPAQAIFMRAVVRPAHRDRRGIVARSAWLTPYTIETIAADARLAGPGATLEVTVPAGAPFATLEHVERRFGFLGSLGVTVDVRHERIGRTLSVV